MSKAADALVSRLAKQSGLSEKSAWAILNALASAANDRLNSKGEFDLPGVGAVVRKTNETTPIVAVSGVIKTTRTSPIVVDPGVFPPTISGIDPTSLPPSLGIVGVPGSRKGAQLRIPKLRGGGII